MSHRSQALEIADVTVARGDRALITELSFRVTAGQKALIVGPNGSGKTSFLRILAGLAPCAAGTITLDGERVDSLPAEHRARLAYRGHLDGLKRELTVRENLEIYAALHARSNATDLEVLDALGLSEILDRPLREVSAGQRRRVGLAVLRLLAADLWILDEPMTNLDAAGRRLVADWVAQHISAGGLAVVATHQPEELVGGGTILVEL